MALAFVAATAVVTTTTTATVTAAPAQATHGPTATWWDSDLSDGYATVVFADNTGDGFARQEKFSSGNCCRTVQHEGPKWKARTNSAKYTDINGTGTNISYRYYAGRSSGGAGNTDYGVTCSELDSWGWLTLDNGHKMTCVQIDEAPIENYGEACGPNCNFSDGVNSGIYGRIAVADWVADNAEGWLHYNIMCHEAGHIYGIGHGNDPENPDRYQNPLDVGDGCLGGAADDKSEHSPDFNQYESDRMLSNFHF